MKINSFFLIFIISADITIISGAPSYNYSGYSYKFMNQSINSATEIIQKNDDDSSVLLYVNYRRGDYYSTGADFKVEGVNIMKTGKSSNLENSLSYCINSAVLDSGLRINLNRTDVKTNDEGAIALCATDEGSMTAYDSSISTLSKNSIGMHASKKSSVTGRGSSISTTGENSPAMSGQKDTWISAYNCQLYTSKKGSPLFQTLGDLEIKDSYGWARNSHAIIADGSNYIAINNTALNCSWEEVGDDASDVSGILLKNTSFDQNSDSDTSSLSFTFKNSFFETNSEIAPMIIVDDSQAYIELRDSKVKSKIFLKINSKINIYLYDSDIEGDIIGDENSNMYLELVNTKFKGAIDPDNKAGYVNIHMISNSNITLTGNSNCDYFYSADQTNSNLIKNSFSLNGLEEEEEDSSSILLNSKMMLLLLVCFMI